MESLRKQALAALNLCDPAAKCHATHTLAWDVANIGSGEQINASGQIPGRPQAPQLVRPSEVKRRSVHTPQGHAALIHALAHIELNAINLALDILWRFGEMPDAFYRDWLGVAQEEASHFEMLRAHLQSLGADYGDFTAHDGLWDMAEKTRDDILARLALVPRTLEARGLDVSPVLRDKLRAIGDDKGADILAIILRDEIGHVAVGNRWYREVCAARGLDAISAYPGLAQRYAAPRLRQPFNMEARRAAGFAEDELAALILASE